MGSKLNELSPHVWKFYVSRDNCTSEMWKTEFLPSWFFFFWGSKLFMMKQKVRSTDLPLPFWTFLSITKTFYLFFDYQIVQHLSSHGVQASTCTKQSMNNFQMAIGALFSSVALIIRLCFHSEIVSECGRQLLRFQTTNSNTRSK